MQNIDFLYKMVGRENEIRELQAYLDKAAEGEGSTIFISGEAGIGKTRLVEELKQIAQSKGFQILSGNSMYETLTPFMPIMEALKSGGLESLFAEETPKVEAVYLVTHSGLLIKEVVRQETSLDPDMFSSVLTTLSDFVSESLSTLLGEEKDGTLSSLGFENYRIVIESGKNANLVVIISGKENEFLINDMNEIIQNTNKKYGYILENWGGDEEDIIGIEEFLKPLIISGKYDGIHYGKDDPKIRRNLLFENVTLGLKRQAQQTPTLLCIEDLQWADPSSLALMHYIARDTRKSGLIILNTYRPEDITTTDGKENPLARTMQQMDRKELYDKIELSRLPEESMDEFLFALLGKIDFTDEFKNRIYQETEGNPLFIIQLIKYMVDEKIILEDEGAWKLVMNLKDIEIPSKMYNVIERRLNRLEKKDRRVLDYASVIGEKFKSSILVNALDMNRTRLLEQLRDLEQIHRLIRSRDGLFKFDHAKIKEVLYSDIPKELRMEYHKIIANSIETVNQDNLDEVIGDLAFHYYQCKYKEKALHYLIKAAEKAKKEYSNEEAIRFFEQALELEDDVKNRTKMCEAIGDIYFLIGKYDMSIQTYHSAIDQVDVKKKPGILAKIGGVLQKQGEHDECIRICTEALDLVGDEENKEKALAFENIGMVYWDRADHQKSLEYFNKSLRIREKINDQKDIARSLINISSVYRLLYELDKSFEYAEKSLKISEDIGNQQGIAESFQAMGVAIAEKGSGVKALPYYERSLKIWEKIGDQREIARALNNIGLNTEDFSKGVAICQRSLDIFEKIGNPWGIAWALQIIGLKYGGEEIEKAIYYLEKSQEICNKNNIHILSSLNHFFLSDHYLNLKDYEKALYFCKEAYDLSKMLNNKSDTASALKKFGIILGAQKKWEESIKYFNESYKIYKELGLRKGLADHHYDFGLIWRDKGDIDNAKKHLNKALEIYEEMKWEDGINKAKKELETL